MGPSDKLQTRIDHEDSCISKDGAPHDIARMIAELNDPYPSFDVPQHACHVPRTRDNLPVIDETAATEIARVSAEFTSSLHAVSVFVVEIVDGTDVVQTPASNEVARRGICAGHDPTGPKRDSMNFVGCVCVPNNEFSVL